MPTGLEISRDFIQRIILPLLRRELGDDYARVAVGVLGTGSEILGLDDAISRDHHWGPRATVLVTRADAAQLLPKIQTVLTGHCPRRDGDFEVQVGLGHLVGVCWSTIEDFHDWFLGTDQLPQTDLDWLKLCEVDLLHVTAGEMVYDGLGEMTRRRQHLEYYPANVWKKRVADWCMYTTGRDAPYNLNRVSRRGDVLTSTIYFGQCLRRLMELCFALNRRYAPYTKWLNVSFRRLPKYAADVAPFLDEALAATDPRKRVLALVEANYCVAEALADLGLTKPPHRRPFDEGLTDLTLYDSAGQIYSALPRALLEPSFNQIEVWEKLARLVVLDPEDYVQKKYEKRETAK